MNLSSALSRPHILPGLGRSLRDSFLLDDPAIFHSRSATTSLALAVHSRVRCCLRAGSRVFSPGGPSAVNPRIVRSGGKSPSTYALRRPLRPNDKYTKSRAPVLRAHTEMSGSMYASVYKSTRVGRTYVANTPPRRCAHAQTHFRLDSGV